MKDKIIRVLLDDALWKENYKSFASFLDLLQSEYEARSCKTQHEEQDFKIEGYFIGSAFRKEEIVEIVRVAEPFLKPFSLKFVDDYKKTFHRIFTEDSGRLFTRLANELIDSAYENLSNSDLDQELIESKIRDIEDWLKNIDQSKEEITISNAGVFGNWLKEIRKLEKDLKQSISSKQEVESSKPLALIDSNKGDTRSFIFPTDWVSRKNAENLASLLILFGIYHLLSEKYGGQILNAIRINRDDLFENSPSSVAVQPFGEIQIDRRDPFSTLATNPNILLVADTVSVSTAVGSGDVIVDCSRSCDLSNLIPTIPSQHSLGLDAKANNIQEQQVKPKESAKAQQAKTVVKDDLITLSPAVHVSNTKHDLAIRNQDVEVFSKQSKQAKTDTSKTGSGQQGNRRKNNGSISSDKGTQGGVNEPTEPIVAPPNTSSSSPTAPPEETPTFQDFYIKDVPNDSSNLIDQTLYSPDCEPYELQNYPITSTPVLYNNNIKYDLTSKESQQDSLLGIQNKILTQGDIALNADSIIGNTNTTTKAFSTKENLVSNTLNASANTSESKCLTNLNGSCSQGSLNRATYQSDLTNKSDLTNCLGNTQQNQVLPCNLPLSPSISRSTNTQLPSNSQLIALHF